MSVRRSLRAVTRRRRTSRLAESEQRYKSLFDHNPDAVYSFDLQGRFTSMNAAGVLLAGYDDADVVLEQTFADLVHPDDLVRVGGHFAGAVAGEPQRYECRIVRPDGLVLSLDVTNSAIVVDDEVVGVFGVAKDISARLAAEQSLALSKQRYKALYHRNPDPVYSLDLEGRFVSGNTACLELTGYGPQALLHVPFVDVVDAQSRDHTLAAFAEALGGKSVTYECGLLRLDGSRLQLRVLNIPVVVDGEVVGVYGMAKDITERRRLELELLRQARSDALTGLANRTELAERLTERLAGGDAWLLFVDLDRFKVVNDSLGHEAGDALLRAVADRLRATLREQDVLVRFGGDEFCVVLAVGTGSAEARLVAERVSQAVRPVFQVCGYEVHVTASVGITQGALGDGADELLRQADVAMYQAKTAGRDRISVYRPGGDDTARSRLSLENELRRALDGDELVLHHQPQLRLHEDGDVIVGAEALVRWQHPQRGLLPPADFLPTVHAAGLAVALDQWVLRGAVAAAAGWPAELGVSVNVSPESLLSPCWRETVEQALADSGLAPCRLTVEITEGSLLLDPGRVEQVLHDLRGRGVSVALDDFGTGWSSLAYLERYPVDVLKIDRMFVSRLADDETAPVVDAVLGLARALGLRTVAEGVETEEQRARLLRAGCDAFQGYLASRPVPECELLALLAVPSPRGSVSAGLPALR